MGGSQSGTNLQKRNGRCVTCCFGSGDGTSREAATRREEEGGWRLGPGAVVGEGGVSGQLRGARRQRRLTETFQGRY